MEIQYIVEPEEAFVRLQVFLRRKGVSTSYIRRVKYEGQGLTRNGCRARTNEVVQPGDVVGVLAAPEEPCHLEAEDIPFEIVYESPHAMVINKPAGLVVHPTLSHKGGTLGNGFARLMQTRGTQRAFRPIGRLDGDTSGLMLCAMHGLAAPVLERRMKKQYIAIAKGALPLGAGCIDAPLGACEGSAILQQVRPDGKPSVTEYCVLVANDEASLVLVAPQTGRTHQIRVHFAHMGHPLLGDGLYGGDKELIQRHALHCARVEFAEPDGAVKAVELFLPPDMRRALRLAGFAEEILEEVWANEKGCFFNKL